MRIERDLVFGQSGSTSAQLEAHLDAAIASRADTVVVNVTTNDCRTASGTLPEVFARYRRWRDQLRAAGKLQIWCDGQPRADTPGGDYAPERNAILRDFIRAEMNAPDSRCIVALTFPALGRYPDLLLPADGMLRDDLLHNAYAGAIESARAIVSAAVALFDDVDPQALPAVTRIEAGFTGGGDNSTPGGGAALGGSWSVTVSPGITWRMSDDELGRRWIDFTVNAVTLVPRS